MLLLSILFACGDKSTDTSTTDTDTQTDTDTEDTDQEDTDTEDTDTEDTDPVEEGEITDIILEVRSGDCADYIQDSYSEVTDIQRNMAFTGDFVVTVNSEKCVFTTNSIPNHDFNDATASFATPVSEVSASYEVTQNPIESSDVTTLTLEYDNAVFLNGGKLDLLAAACYGVGNEPLGQEKIGCNDSEQPWRYDPMFGGNDFGTDAHQAHTQPDGTYHYHGDPLALYDLDGTAESGVIGFAADGFPIFGPYINENGNVRRVVSGYTLKSGDRVSQNGEGAFPGGTHDGTFRDDYEFTNAGDLDECNGMTRDGVYGYYATDSFPWVLNCFQGSPDESFRKGPN